MTEQETTLTPEIIETPETKDVVSDVVGEKESGEKEKAIKSTENQLEETMNLSERLTKPTHKDPDKKQQVEELKKELEEQKEPLVEKITKEEQPEKKHHTHEHKEEHHKTKSESKLWEKTKKVLNRPLDHTPLKYITKKPLSRIKKHLLKK